MLVSSELISFVKKFEGFSPTPYKDMVGVLTLGYGMTGSEIKGIKSVTETQACSMLTRLINSKYASPISTDLDNHGVALNQNQFDALVSMAYNVGVGGLLSSTLYRHILNGVRNKEILLSDFQMWNKAGGNVVQGLLRRRTEECEMFMKAITNQKSPKILLLQQVCNRVGIRGNNALRLIEDGLDGDNTRGARLRLIKYIADVVK